MRLPQGMAGHAKFLDDVYSVKLREVKRAVKAGASLRKGDKHGLDALYFAVSNLGLAPIEKQEELISFLIESGADLEKKYKYLSGFTPLICAASNGKGSLIRLLLDRGAKIDEPDGHGYTPLMRAALLGHAEAVSILLKRGANAALKNSDGETALDLALYGQKEDSGLTEADFKTVIRLLDAASGSARKAGKTGSRTKKKSAAR